MKTSHEGLGISDSDWGVLMQHARATFDDVGVAENEKNEALSAVDGLKGEIVEVHSTAHANR
jgi:hemoglobin